MDFRYSSSTFFLAQGVRRKNVRLDLMLGLSVKHLMGMRLPSSSQPYCATSWFRRVSSVIPCRRLFGCSFAIHILFRGRDRPGRLRVQGIHPDAAFIHHGRHPVRLRQGLEFLPVHEVQDQLMRRLLSLEALLNPDQEVLGAFPRDLKFHGDDLEWFGLMHVFYPAESTNTACASTTLLPSISGRSKAFRKSAHELASCLRISSGSFLFSSKKLACFLYRGSCLHCSFRRRSIGLNAKTCNPALITW